MSYSIFIHTHSDCDDALKMCLGQLDKYMPNVERWIAIEKETETVSNENIIIYDEEDSYSERLELILPEIENDMILYLHEDMILYDEPNMPELDRCEQYLRDNDAMMIKLIGTIGMLDEVAPSIRNSSGPYRFAVQPTLWKKDKFKELVEGERYNIWEMEDRIQGKFLLTGTGYTYFRGDEKLRGQSHYDSHIFPYIATAIVKGKWNNLEYSSELKSLFDEYDVNSDREMMV
tara:strand:- start:24 stop:719 length:696 start_codon:yes stop_codon:yes gene_type:complete